VPSLAAVMRKPVSEAMAGVAPALVGALVPVSEEKSGVAHADSTVRKSEKVPAREPTAAPGVSDRAHREQPVQPAREPIAAPRVSDRAHREQPVQPASRQQAAGNPWDGAFARLKSEFKQVEDSRTQWQQRLSSNLNKVEEARLSWQQKLTSDLGRVIIKSNEIAVEVKALRQHLVRLEGGVDTSGMQFAFNKSARSDASGPTSKSARSDASGPIPKSAQSDVSAQTTTAVVSDNCAASASASGANTNTDGLSPRTYSEPNFGSMLDDMQKRHDSYFEEILEYCMRNRESEQNIRETLDDLVKAQKSRLDMSFNRFSLGSNERNRTSIKSLPQQGTDPLVVFAAVDPSLPRDESQHPTAHSSEKKHASHGKERCSISAVYDCRYLEDSDQWRLGLVQKISVALVLLNALVAGLNAEIGLAYARRGEIASPYAHIPDYAFLLAFFLELLARLKIERRQFILGPQRKWNIFDSIVIAVQFFQYFHGMRGVVVLRLLRFIRVLQLARILRTLKGLRPFKLMVSGTVWQPLLGGGLLLICLAYAFALLLSQQVADFIAADGNSEIMDDLLALYGSVPDTMVTLFMAISGGDAWRNLLLPLDSISVWCRLLFLAYVFTTVFGVLQIVAAVYIDGVILFSHVDRDIATAEKRHAELGVFSALRELLHAADTNSNGKLSQQEFLDFIHQKEGKTILAKLGVDAARIATLYELLDFEETGRVDIGQFLNAIPFLSGNPETLHAAMTSHQNRQMSNRIDLLAKRVDENFVRLLGEDEAVTGGCTHGGNLEAEDWTKMLH